MITQLNRILSHSGTRVRCLVTCERCYRFCLFTLVAWSHIPFSVRWDFLGWFGGDLFHHGGRGWLGSLLGLVCQHLMGVTACRRPILMRRVLVLRMVAKK